MCCGRCSLGVPASAGQHMMQNEPWATLRDGVDWSHPPHATCPDVGWCSVLNLIPGISNLAPSTTTFEPNSVPMVPTRVSTILAITHIAMAGIACTALLCVWPLLLLLPTKGVVNPTHAPQCVVE